MYTDPKKKLMFDRALKIIKLVLEDGHVKTEVVAHELGVSDRVAHVNCKKLVNAGVLRSTKGAGGGYFIAVDSIKVGHLFAAMGMPMLETGKESVDNLFKKYLDAEVFSV